MKVAADSAAQAQINKQERSMHIIDLKHGDCIDIMKDIPDKSVDMILCDLPYGITRNSWDTIIPFDELWEGYCRVIKDNGAILLFGNGLFTAKLMISNEKMFRYNLIWEKPQGSYFLNAKRKPLKAHEDICVFYKHLPTYNPQFQTGKPYKATSSANTSSNYDKFDGEFTTESDGKRYPKTVLKFDNTNTSKKLHPTQKPVALCEYLIKTYSNEGETVLDNCMGSGTTGVAARNTNRNFIGIELDEGYFNIAKGRIENT